MMNRKNEKKIQIPFEGEDRKNEGKNPDLLFIPLLWMIGGLYVVLILAMLLADLLYVKGGDFVSVLVKPEIRYAVKLSLLSSALSSGLAVVISLPLGYLMSRQKFRGKSVIEVILDIPVVLPPVVVGLSLLLLFRLLPSGISDLFIFEVPAVIVAQVAVITAFGVRMMKVAFDQIDPRQEQVALTLGCSRWQAFTGVLLPQAKKSIISSLALCWAKSLGEFGPILVFAGATRMKTEVMTTSVYLELSTGNIETAVAVAIMMIILSSAVLFVVRRYGAATG